MDWIIEIQTTCYYTEADIMNKDFYKAMVFKDCSEQEMAEKCKNLPGLKYSKCMRKAVPYQEAEQKYLAREKEDKLREDRYKDLLLLAAKSPERVITLLVQKPFVGTLTATATEVIKVIDSKWHDFELVKHDNKNI